MKQPFQCNLQPEIQEPHGTMHTDTTTRCKTHRRKNSRTKRPQPHPSHRRGTFHRRLQPLYTEKQGLVLRLPPQNIAHATFMQPLQCVSQHPVANPHLSTHVATSNDDNEAAIPMHSANRDSRTAWFFKDFHLSEIRSRNRKRNANKPKTQKRKQSFNPPA